MAAEAENAGLMKMLVDRNLEIDVMKEINAHSGGRTGPAGTGLLRSTAWTALTAGVCADERGVLLASLGYAQAGQGCASD